MAAASGGSGVELFFAASGVLRAFDVSSGQLDALDVFRCSADDEFVQSVAYSAHTDTLFISTGRVGGSLAVRSLARRTGSDTGWCECQRLDVPLFRAVLRGLSDGVFWSAAHLKADTSCWFWRWTARMHFSRVRDSSTCRIDTTRRSTRSSREASCGWQSRCTEAHDEEQYPPSPSSASKDMAQWRFSRCALREPWSPLFYGDNLLVYERTADDDDKDWEVLEFAFATGGGRPEPCRSILSGRDLPDSNWHHPVWCVANDTLFAYNIEHCTLTSYSIL